MWNARTMSRANHAAAMGAWQLIGRLSAGVAFACLLLIAPAAAETPTVSNVDDLAGFWLLPPGERLAWQDISLTPAPDSTVNAVAAERRQLALDLARVGGRRGGRRDQLAVRRPIRSVSHRQRGVVRAQHALRRRRQGRALHRLLHRVEGAREPVRRARASAGAGAMARCGRRDAHGPHERDRRRGDAPRVRPRT